MWRKWIFLLIAVFVIAADQLTKLWIINTLLPGESWPETCHLSITHLQNTGAAFGLFTNNTFPLTLIAILGLLVILLFYRHLPQSSILGTIALGLLFGGATGNLIDRIRLGYVTDFIYFRLWDNVYWPAFNIADSAITIGVITLSVFLLLGLKKQDVHNT